MALSTLDNLAAQFQPLQFFHKIISGGVSAGVWHSLWGMPGIPGPGTYPSTLAGTHLTNPTAGQIPVSSVTTSVLTFFSAMNFAASNLHVGGLLLLCDRLWHNGGINTGITTAQSIGANSFRFSSAGRKFIGLELSVAGTTASNTITLQTISGLETANPTNHYVTGLSPAAGTFIPFNGAFNTSSQLTDFDALSSITMGASQLTGATVHLVVYSVLAILDLRSMGRPDAIDFINGAGAYINTASVPFLIYVPRTTQSTANYQRLVGTIGTATI